MSAQSSPQKTYLERRAAFAAEEKRLAGISFRFSILRGVLFLLFLGCLLLILIRGGRPGWEWWAGAGFWLLAFLAVLSPHQRIVQRQRPNRGARQIPQDGIRPRARERRHPPLSALP